MPTTSNIDSMLEIAHVNGGCGIQLESKEKQPSDADDADDEDNYEEDNDDDDDDAQGEQTTDDRLILGAQHPYSGDGAAYSSARHDLSVFDDCMDARLRLALNDGHTGTEQGTGRSGRYY
jgi:hypothetical protein